MTPVFADLNRYEVTTHFNGQSTVTLEGDRATGESYTIAHHVYTEDGNRKIMVASLRYLDTFTKVDGRWYFAERKLIVDWAETRPLKRAHLISHCEIRRSRPRTRGRSADLLGQPDEDALGASDVAEPIHVFVLDHFADELRAILAEPASVSSRSSTANMTRR